MLHLVQSNRLDVLADALLARWDAAAGDGVPETQTIIVPGGAMERWLSWRIADRLGICAGIEFGFPASFVWKMFARALPGVPAHSPFDRDLVTLRLFELLGELPEDAAFAPLRRYVERTDELRHLELARRISQVYSQYMLYRPDWLAAWDRGKRVPRLSPDTQDWQAALWARLRTSLGATQLHHPREDFFAQLAKHGPKGIVPPRLRVFALPSIPPMYAEILCGLGRHIDVEWYHLNPCAQFWADIRNEKAKARLDARDDPAGPLTEVGHPLLASWGEQRRQQLAVLADAVGEDNTDDQSQFDEPDPATVLGRLQHSLLTLEEPVDKPLAPQAGDVSLQIHVCHSLTRQLEVLHDRLQALFDAMPDLKASDVAVFLPDLDGAAPVIDAVFGAVAPDRAIPYAITGRARPDDTAYLQAVDFLLRLPESRFDAASVLGFLEIPAAMARFELEASDIEVIRHWLHEAGARWGLDAEHRAGFGVPAEPRHTWSDALHRLLAGYALPTGADAPLSGVLPFGELEGAQARTLGKLARLIGVLAAVAESLRAPRPLSDWTRDIRAALDNCLQPTDDDLADERRVRDALASIGQDAAALEASLALETARELLLSHVASSAQGAVPSGRVTFCGLGPLRGLPYRVLCFLGVDHDVFPRNPPQLEFDLMAESPRGGDRKPREEDRGTFLDGLMCASDVFYVSYTGRSIRDNGVLPPSVVVSELLDYLGRHHRDGPAGATKDFVTAHPLQPFDSAYFGAPRKSGSPLYSYDADLLPAARALQAPLAGRPEMRGIAGDAPLPESEADLSRIEMDDLIWFFRNPASRFLKRLGVRIGEVRAEISPDEPFELDQPWLLEDAILERRLSGWPIESCVEYALSRSDVPHGAWGRESVTGRAAQVEAFAQRVEAARGETMAPLVFSLPLAGGEFTGTLTGLRTAGLLGYGLKKEGASELLNWWIQHLVLCVLRPPGVAPVTRLLLADSELEFAPVPEAAETLADLCTAYREGMRAPLPFYPKTAWALVSGDERKALGVWCGNPRKAGEREHARYRLLHGGEPDTPPSDWDRCAQRILGPMQAACSNLAELAVDDDE